MEKKPNETWKLDKRDRLVIITRGISDQRLREICNAERDGRCLIIQSVHGISINDHSGDPVGDPGPIGPEMSYIEMAAELDRCKSDLAKAEETLAMMMDMDYQQRVKTIFGLPVERVQELVRADKENRCVVLPCELGRTVFTMFGDEVVAKKVSQFRVNSYTNPMIWADLDCKWMTTQSVRWDLAIGKNVFFTARDLEIAKSGGKDEV